MMFKVIKKEENSRGLTWANPSHLQGGPRTSESCDKIAHRFVKNNDDGLGWRIAQSLDEAKAFVGTVKSDESVMEDIERCGYGYGVRRQDGSDSYNLLWVIIPIVFVPAQIS